MRFLLLSAVAIVVLLVVVVGISTVIRSIRGTIDAERENDLLREHVEVRDLALEKIRREVQLQLVHPDPDRLVEHLDAYDDALRPLPVLPAKRKKSIGR